MFCSTAELGIVSGLITDILRSGGQETPLLAAVFIAHTEIFATVDNTLVVSGSSEGPNTWTSLKSTTFTKRFTQWD
jgi:hypothetical protein